MHNLQISIVKDYEEERGIKIDYDIVCGRYRVTGTKYAEGPFALICAFVQIVDEWIKKAMADNAHVLFDEASF